MPDKINGRTNSQKMLWDLTHCSICPRFCGTNRYQKPGFCGGRTLPKVAKAMLHFWEEPCISGDCGSGAVFFSGCSLRCVYCQNYRISAENFGQEVTVSELAAIFGDLQSKGAHNINLVSPTHYAPQIAEALALAGLRIPVIYNCGGYESVETVQKLAGLIDIYLPDLKYMHRETAAKYSGAADYFAVATAALQEMVRQVGGAQLNEEGLLQKGLLIRHLILPGQTAESIAILDWIAANLPSEVLVSLMCQYVPMGQAAEFPEINRKLRRKEYEAVLAHLFALGLENGFVQELSAANAAYTPEFDLAGIKRLPIE